MTTNKRHIFLSDIVSVDRFIADIAAGRIQERVHPDNPDLRIYSYTKMTQYGGLWTAESRLARGLILDVPEGDFERATVRSRGLPKFFTIQQSQESWGRAKLIDDDENVVVDEAPVIPWHLTANVSEKLNGALGLGYIDPSGRFRISTKGSFGSLEAQVANRILDSKYPELTERLSRAGRHPDFPRTSTLLFEIITPERPHPVDYGDLEDLILLGQINNGTGVWTPARPGVAGAQLSEGKPGFPYARTFEVRSLKEAVELPYENNTEGLVVTIVNGGPEQIYKVKPAEYLQLRKLFYALQESELKVFASDPRFAHSIAELDGPEAIDLTALVGGLQLSDQMAAMLKDRQEKLFEEIVLPARKLIGDISEEFVSWGRTVHPGDDWILAIPRGDVARWVKGKTQDLQGLYFSVYELLLGNGKERAYQSAVNRVLAAQN